MTWSKVTVSLSESNFNVIHWVTSSCAACHFMAHVWHSNHIRSVILRSLVKDLSSDSRTSIRQAKNSCASHDGLGRRGACSVSIMFDWMHRKILYCQHRVWLAWPPRVQQGDLKLLFRRVIHASSSNQGKVAAVTVELRCCSKSPMTWSLVQGH